ncbi:chromosome partitioning protein [uncultured Cellulomonas sp.]|uniref:chromosome partitioning protein n=1 Tax=uncultured Cellulomonas sp. TaxID=189682 RepID=UPI00260D8F92|nr:chromosome partitioning protein [uncultured Cellulomonas sp.]
MTENLPESFDPRQPDLPTWAVDPNPIPDDHEGEAPTTEPLGDETTSGEGSGAEGVPG